MSTIRRVAVAGAGTMGSRIAAHFANAGVPALLLDIVAPGEADRDAAARRGLQSAASQKPAAFYTTAARGLVTIGNLEDDLEQLESCDWIIEAVIEDLEIKRELWRRVEPFASGAAILSTNTSGISIGRICEGFPPEFRQRFLGTHFFNPPRYLHLVELIPGPETSPEILLETARFCDLRLGKGVVPAKDTPNFVGNRIGAFFGATVHQIAAGEGYSVEEVDALTGPLIGLPKSASFRLLDIIGLDVWHAVLENLSDLYEGETWRGRFRTPGFLSEMIERGWIGEKAGQGFYRRVNKDGQRVIEAIDFTTFEYHEAVKPEFPSVQEALGTDDLGARLRQLVASDDRAGRFLWRLLGDLFLYSAERVPEISDRIVEIDRAMRWGYGFQLGPFEMWDAIGFENVARRLEIEGGELPENVRRMLESGAKSFYQEDAEDGAPRTEYFDLTSGAYLELEPQSGVVRIAGAKRAGGTLRENESASLVDLGDGVLCVEFHGKMNAIADDILAMTRAGLEEAEKNFEAVVIANEGAHFSVGADLKRMLAAAREGDFTAIERMLRAFQEMNMAIRCAARPVVAAPFGYTLGGGCEVVLHSERAQAAAETYMGLVEVGVGLIPAAGGCKQMLLRLGDADKAYKLIAAGRFSSSAAHARELGLLRAADRITMNPDRLVADAKALALSLTRNYVPATPCEDIAAAGEAVFAKLKLGAWLAREAGRISVHDLVVSEKLAHVLCGGRLTGKQTVSEHYLLDLEREAFLSLCGMPKTRERIEHVLKTGKPLRN